MVWYIFTCLKILFSLLVSSLTHWLFNLHIFVELPISMLLISSFIPLWLEKIHGMISVFPNLLRIFYYLSYELSWRMFHLCLRRIGILFSSNGTPWMCLLGLFGLKCSSNLIFSCWFWVDDLPFVESGVLRLLTILVLLSVSPFQFVSIYLIYLGAPKLSAYIFKNYYIFFMSYSFYINYIMTLFLTCHCFWCKEVAAERKK